MKKIEDIVKDERLTWILAATEESEINDGLFYEDKQRAKFDKEVNPTNVTIEDILNNVRPWYVKVIRRIVKYIKDKFY